MRGKFTNSLFKVTCLVITGARLKSIISQFLSLWKCEYSVDKIQKKRNCLGGQSKSRTAASREDKEPEEQAGFRESKEHRPVTYGG